MSDTPAGRIAALDIGLFSIETQTSDSDRTSLLRLQRMVRGLHGRYGYLEIGSHLGGTLLPHLLDPACSAVHSVDPRPSSQPDDRGRWFDYDGNSTARMRELLAEAVPPAGMERLVTWDHDAAAIPAHAYRTRFELVLIDGEHTTVAAFSDFVSVLPALAQHACIAFHDANIVLDAIANAERLLRHMGTRHATHFLPDNVAVISLRAAADAAEEELAPVAHRRADYEAWTRAELRRMIAENSAQAPGAGE
jgi:hypothetical protein